MREGRGRFDLGFGVGGKERGRGRGMIIEGEKGEWLRKREKR